jgi:polar amino acid transport system substrate-binding protein
MIVSRTVFLMSSLLTLRHGALWASVTVLILVGVVSPDASRQPAPLNLVSTAWPPFTNAQGLPRFALDLVEDALGRAGLTTKTTIVNASQYTSWLLSDQFDGSGAAWMDSARERALVFSQPYLENRLVLVGRRGADVSAKRLAELAGKRVAIVEGYSYGDAIDLTGPVFVRSGSEEDSLTQLLKAAVDYTLMDELVVHYIVGAYPDESRTRLQIGSTPLMTRALHLAISRRRADADSIVARFNAELRGMMADRTYHRVLHVDWIRADVDGDGIPEFVPRNDRIGPVEPQQIYTLFSPPDSEPAKAGTPRFYVGGNIYRDWASVPESYKDINPRYPDPRRSEASIFKFTW